MAHLEVRVVRAEVLDPREQFVEGDPDLQAGQVGAQAAVHSHTEGNVRVAVPGEVELIRAVKSRGVVVGRVARTRWPERRCRRDPVRAPPAGR